MGGKRFRLKKKHKLPSLTLHLCLHRYPINPCGVVSSVCSPPWFSGGACDSSVCYEFTDVTSCHQSCPSFQQGARHFLIIERTETEWVTCSQDESEAWKVFQSFRSPVSCPQEGCSPCSSVMRTFWVMKKHNNVMVACGSLSDPRGDKNILWVRPFNNGFHD